MSLVADTYDWAGLLVRDYVLSHYGPEIRVLDVGAGRGKYRILLRTYPHVDACEIWEPIVEREQLRTMYGRVYVEDFVQLTRSEWWADQPYDLVIMGDVLEHITRSDAQDAVARTLDSGADLLVVVPYEYPQGEEDGNEYQCHLQDDLTPELVARDYPELRLIALETRTWKPFKGLYVGSARD